MSENDDQAKKEIMMTAVSENRSRYAFLKTSDTDPRKIMCFDNKLNKIVWGRHEPVEGLHQEYLFVPNV